MSEISSVIIVQKPLQSKSRGWFLYNSNTGLKWQRGCMVKVNIKSEILFIVSRLRRSVKLQPGR